MATDTTTSSDGVALALGDDLRSRIQHAKILVVGAGGIGCELIKNLVLSGFQDIELTDLDTIDVSNLNRQFLFRSHHVGQSKALVAKEVASTFNPRVKITAHHGNIKANEFNMDYFAQFAVVFNALDNIDARKHVNRLCLATNTPLIESGTMGYLGQVSVIKKGETECYECTTKVAQKVYPICTIRSTPDKMVHCIVWAKECYRLLFGKAEDSMLWEEPNESESSFMSLVLRSADMKFDRASLQSYAASVFRGLFDLEIRKKLEMKVYKTAAKRPQPLDLASLLPSYNEMDGTAPMEPTHQVWNDRDVWSVSECARRFLACITRVLESEESRANLGSLEFDKDDALAMEFVTAAGNLRATVFSIAMESLYTCKGIAGNIIPAIATTNAIVAGVQVLQAFKILAASGPIAQECNYTLCSRFWDSRGMLLTPTALSKPNPKCYACAKQMIELAIDTKQTHLRDLVDQVLKKKLGVNEPTVSVGVNTIYEEGEDAETSLAANLDKLLIELPGKGIHHDTVVSIEDFSQDFQCSLHVTHRDHTTFGEDATDPFVLGGELDALAAARVVAQEKLAAEKDQVKSDDDFCEVVDVVKGNGAESPTKKRLRTESSTNAADAGNDKRAKIADLS